MKTYAAYYDNIIRNDSSSGGLFSVIASSFDIVYGVAMTDDNYSCVIIRVEDNINPLRGSKYFQAKVGDAYKNVKEDLKNGKKVLFSGTGCQINGLFQYLGEEFPNLFLLDIICHGVPSPKLWKQYAMFQEDKYGKLEKVNFRDKTEGWKDFGMKENNQFISMHNDSFMQMFLRNYCLRPSCYECHAKYYKKSDMTIGDFWGIQNVAPELDDNKGTSLVIIRTERGKEIFEKIKEKIVYKEVVYEDAVRYNSAEYCSVNRPKLRTSFFTDLDNMSFGEMEKKYAVPIDISNKQKYITKVKRLIMKIFGRI